MIKKVHEVTIEEYEYVADGQKLTAILAFPVEGEVFPVVVDIHGHVIGNLEEIKKFNPAMGRPYTADIKQFVRRGFAVFLPVMVGYGPTGGERDFCGPKTIQGVMEGIKQIVLKDERLKKDGLIVYGVSRGATVAASLATQYSEHFSAAIFQSGAYDAKNSFEKTQIEGIRDNFRNEAGTSEQAFRERSPLFDMEKLMCPVLILHGENDDRIDVSEAKNLDKRLTELGKTHETIIFSEADHFLPRPEVMEKILSFLKKHF